MTKQNRREFLLSLGVGALVAPLAVKAVSNDSLDAQIEAQLQKMFAKFDSLSPERQEQHVKNMVSDKSIAELENCLANRWTNLSLTF